MFAIDEFNNLGWFASDRYQPEGKVCIYVFIPNSSKRVYNYEAMDKKKVVRLAQIHSLKDTWVDQIQYLMPNAACKPLSVKSHKPNGAMTLNL